MSLDVLRAINKSRGAALSALQLRIEKIAQEAESQVTQYSGWLYCDLRCCLETYYHSANQGLSDPASLVVNSVKELLGLVKRHSDFMEAVSRDLCVSIAHIYIAALLLGKRKLAKYDTSIHAHVCLFPKKMFLTVKVPFKWTRTSRRSAPLVLVPVPLSA